MIAIVAYNWEKPIAAAVKYICGNRSRPIEWEKAISSRMVGIKVRCGKSTKQDSQADNVNHRCDWDGGIDRELLLAINRRNAVKNSHCDEWSRKINNKVSNVTKRSGYVKKGEIA